MAIRKARKGPAPRRRRRSDWRLLPSHIGAARVAIQVIVLTVLLHFNATHFDSGEVKTVVGASLVSMILEAVGLRRSQQGG